MDASSARALATGFTDVTVVISTATGTWVEVVEENVAAGLVFVGCVVTGLSLWFAVSEMTSPTIFGFSLFVDSVGTISAVVLLLRDEKLSLLSSSIFGMAN